MPFVRRHITRRLKLAKAECDKELQKVTNSITAFFEEKLREEREYEERMREEERIRQRDIVDDVSDGQIVSGNVRYSNDYPAKATRRQSRGFDDVRSSRDDRERRSSRILFDAPIDPIMTALYDLIAVATEITDTTISQLTSGNKVCETFVQRIQNIGKAWDEHPDWHGRNWYVQVLLAVASLSRVVEWFLAEKHFWNFEDREEGDEEIVFVTKGTALDETWDTSSLPEDFRKTIKDDDLEQFSLDGDNRLRFERPNEEGRQSRDVRPKDLSAESSSSTRESPASLMSGVATMLPPVSAASKILGEPESARVLATERLRLQAETAQQSNIVLELSLDGDLIVMVSWMSWKTVVGTDPDELPGTRISRYLAPTFWTVFRDATHLLLNGQRDDIGGNQQYQPYIAASQPTQGGQAPSPLMEGKGVLMLDRDDGRPSHTMWVLKPIGSPRWESNIISSDSGFVVPATAIVPPSSAASLQTGFPFGDPSDHAIVVPDTISFDPILCRICECQIPQWYFEKHSEACAETHRLEAEISDCNESITELRAAIRDLSRSSSSSSSGSAVLEYRGMPIFSPSSSPVSASPLHLFRNANKMQRLGAKKMQRQILDTLDDILSVAVEISTPALLPDEAKEPIERQRLLPPTSERCLSQIKTWARPQTDDQALKRLINDAERVMRQKADCVVRLQNVIRYAEKVWRQWDERVLEWQRVNEESSGSENETGGEDQDSTASEYAFGAGPTPMESVDATPIPSVSPMPPDSLSPEAVSPMPPASAPLPPASQPSSHTRSSTPSSVSSPLARAVPIVAAPIPPMDLCESKPVTETAKSVKASRSSSSLLVGGEPKLVLTPPASPQVHPRDREQTDLTRESSIRRGRGSGTRHRRHSTVNAMPGSAPLSPRQPSVAPLSRTTPTTIKDFDIIKPISKGAFGSVFLARKKATGDYYAIKVLKKADMIAKNQITNVKAERMILMKQAESPFVAKLYFTFQSKENLYLVMEYLNGGDCAALLKSLGCLSEEWAKNYVAEVVLGLEYLHERGIVHRDLKPDNLLINQHGHLKLTDFGLSRIGLLGRQTLEADPLAMSRYGSRSRPPSMDSAYLSSPLIYADHSSNAGGGSYFAIGTRSTSSRTASSSPYLPITDDVSESSGSELAGARLARRKTVAESGVSSFANELTTDLRSHSSNVRSDAGAPPGGQKFAGTPDYLAPETILGLRGNDAMVDWWALGVVTYEFLYGAPPFHDETPEKVFENILSGHVEYHEAWIGYSDEVMDFMTRLLKLDPATRLGANGAQEVKAHPWFRDINWETVTTTEAQFIPQVTDPENTEYFDPRGAIPQLFQDDDQVALPSNTDSPAIDPTMPPPSALSSSHRSTNSRDPGVTSPGDDFGSFSFKNLPVLKQANDDVIRKLKTDQLTPLTQALSESSLHVRRRSVSQRIKKPPNVVTNVDSAKSPPSTIFTNPPSPSTSSSSIASSPSRISLPAAMPGSGGHGRKPSDLGQVERFKLNHLEGERRNSLPSRLRTSSVSSVGDGSGSENWNGSSVGGSNAIELNTPATSIHSIDLKKNPDPNDRVVTCLLAEDNPITSKIIETLLVRIGCRCYTVADGSEAVSVAMSDIKFDCILMDLHMPVLDGEGASRYIKSTNGRNCQTPVIAVSAYSDVDPTADGGSLFAAYLPKPLNKASLLAVMRQLGFKVTSAVQGGPSKVAPAPSLSSGLHDLSRKITA
ncbi:hypothetical protein FISHEDRAFT_41620 [Fistulina hepatica ATCC 64428]|nr:hypothetical protein FISHEDRAFT_41620 [Fistulina hepatica ATCC 64428]